ncbi:MAG: prolipoprotein diacylglyceryl transferase, partial [Verrucomicrobiae bacterium]|nr:prolipoprotein diacylglyceryl transferase [Verrucomicrobiae bacterium]
MLFWAYFQHHFDPVIFPIYGPLAVRWYGLAYFLGFLIAYFLLLHLSRKKILVVPPNHVGDFVAWVAFWGILLGGRMGYVLFYQPAMLLDPVEILQVWKGGMSAHGGVVGTILAMVWYARRHKLPFLNLGDNMVCVVPVGLGFGRLANFINGELYGNPTTVPWAVIFPDGHGGWLGPRHPSQLYEALGEGLFLFVLIWTLRHSAWSVVPGRLGGLFLLAYGVIRTGLEFFRAPDAGLILGLSRGQFYSLFMVAAGAG